MISRRDLLTTAPLAVAGMATAQRLPVQAPLPDTLPATLVTELYAQLATVVTKAKAHSITAQDIARLHGMLSMVFPFWILDGTVDKLNTVYNPATFTEPANLRANMASLMKGHGIPLEESDFSFFDQVPDNRAQMPETITQLMAQSLAMQELQTQRANRVHTTVYGSVVTGANYVPIHRYYYREVGCNYPFMPVALAAGMTAAIGWWNPIVVAVFGTIAALGFIADWLFC